MQVTFKLIATVALSSFLVSANAGPGHAHAHQHATELKAMKSVAANIGINMPVMVTTGELPAGNAQAHLNLKAQQCEITLGTERAAPHLGKFYAEELWPKFLAYHEVAHCVLYSRPGNLTGADNLTEVENKILQDSFALHYIKFDADFFDGFYTNHNVLFHEMYADTFAIMMLLRDGVKLEDLAFIREMRQQLGLAPSHDTASAIDRLMVKLAIERPTDLDSIDKMAKQVSIAAAFKRLSLGEVTGDGKTFIVGPQMVSTLKNVYNQSGRGKLVTESYMHVDTDTKQGLEMYSAVKHSMDMSSEVAKYKDDNAFVEGWLQAKYGMSRVEWNEVALKLSAKLEALALSK